MPGNPVHGAHRAIRTTLRPVRRAWTDARLKARSLATPAKLRAFDRLHLGAGKRQINGWANLDLTGDANLIWDLRDPLPVPPGAVRLFYSEHFIEHITRDDALRLMTNCRAVIAPNGVLRVSTPDLRRLAEDFLHGRRIEMADYGWSPSTPCRMLNEAMRSWGHTFVYDEAELTALLHEAGFGGVRRVAWRESQTPDLRGLETRPDHGDLILEATP